MAKRTALFAGTAAALAWLSLPAMAEDAVAASRIAGQVSTSYSHKESEISIGATGNTDTLAGAASLLYRIDQNLNLQTAFDYNSHDSENRYYSWDISGALFARDASLGLLGLAGSAGRLGDDEFHINNYSIGPIVELYHDNLTFGTRANYTRMEASFLPTYDAGDVSLYGIVYLNDDVALKANGTYGYTETSGLSAKLYAVGAEAEYRITNQFGLFVGGEYTNLDNADFDVDTTEAIIGARYYFGSDNTTLKSVHRSTTIDNVSFWIKNLAL